MPFIQVQLSLKINENQKNDLQSKLTDVVAAGFSKPKMYIMSEIEDEKSLFMGGNKLEKAAYINISLLGSANKSACQNITKSVCDILSKDFDIEGNNVYVTYHPVDLWGWNGMMF